MSNKNIYRYEFIIFIFLIVFISSLCSTIYAKYILTRNFDVTVSTAPFFFDAEIDTEIVYNNDNISHELTIKNNDDTSYNDYSTTYEISLENNDAFTFDIAGETASNNLITKTLTGGSFRNDALDISFNANVNSVSPTETATLKITSTVPYKKEISLPINLNLHPVNVTLNPNGGAISQSTVTVYKGKTYGELPTPTWAGHVFNGWYSAKTNGTKYESSTVVTTNSSSQTLYAQWTSLLLADLAKSGDYVNLGINYNNVATFAAGTHTPSDDYNSWRIISISEKNGEKYVHLVSEGVPLTYVHATSGVTNPGTASVTNLTTNFFNTAISSTSTNFKFRLCGFLNSSGSIITSISALKSLFANNKHVLVESGTPAVRSMTKNDIDAYIGSTTGNATYLDDYDIFTILTKDQSSTSAPYASYHVATAYNNYLWNVYWQGAIIYTTAEHGIRPVVTLKSSVTTPGKVNGVWQLD